MKAGNQGINELPGEIREGSSRVCQKRGKPKLKNQEEDRKTAAERVVCERSQTQALDTVLKIQKEYKAIEKTVFVYFHCIVYFQGFYMKFYMTAKTTRKFYQQEIKNKQTKKPKLYFGSFRTFNLG